MGEEALRIGDVISAIIDPYRGTRNVSSCRQAFGRKHDTTQDSEAVPPPSRMGLFRKASSG